MTKPDLFLVFVREAFPFINFVILVMIVIMSRRWTGVSVAARVQSLGDEVAWLRGQQRGDEMEYREAIKVTQEGTEQVLKEVRVLALVLQDLKGTVHRVEVLETRADAIDQHVESCPLARRAAKEKT